MVAEAQIKTKEFAITTSRIKLSDINFNEEIYPRKEGHNPDVVRRYAGEIEQIEAAGALITVASDMDLLDGRHRWLAYLTAYEDEPDREIPVRIAEVDSTEDKFLLAVRLNSKHGHALTNADREHSAISLYKLGWTVEAIRSEMSVATSTVSEWVSRTIKEKRESQNRRIKTLWLSCHTTTEIADVVGLSQPQVTARIKVLSESFSQKETDNTPESDGEDESTGATGGGLKATKVQLASANHESDFDPPIYNIWKQQTKTTGSDHPGNSEVSFLDNLVYLYTNPLDIVVDPFMGGGSTIDLCRKRWRRYWGGDRKPIVARSAENELGGIRQHDITDAQGNIKLPDLRGRWGDVGMVYLDPPYWKQAEGFYSEDPTDLANMDLETFNKTLSTLVKDFGKALSPGAFISLIIQPTQWKAPDHMYTDHVGDLLRLVKLPVEMRYSVPYESQQYNAQMVEWAIDNKELLVLTREIIVWRI